MARARRRWRAWQRFMDGERFMFLDETAATTAMTRLRGWCVSACNFDPLRWGIGVQF